MAAPHTVSVWPRVVYSLVFSLLVDPRDVPCYPRPLCLASSPLTPGWPGHPCEIFISGLMGYHNLDGSKLIEHLILW